MIKAAQFETPLSFRPMGSATVQRVSAHWRVLEAEAAQHAAWFAFPYADFESVFHMVFYAQPHTRLWHVTRVGGLAQAREAGADVVLLKREALDAASDMPGGVPAMLERLRYALSGDN